MPLSKRNAIDAVREILRGSRQDESRRLERIDDAMSTPGAFTSSFKPRVSIPGDAPEILRKLAYKAETNYLPILVKNYSQVLKVDGVIMNGRTPEFTNSGLDPWQAWQRNRMDARQVGLHYATLKYGTAYATVLPGERDEQTKVTIPRIDLYSPREMTALYQDPESDEWPMMALAARGNHAYLFEDEVVHILGWGVNGPSGKHTGIPLGSYRPELNSGISGAMEYIEYREHGMEFCPVVRYRDRYLLNGEEQFGIVEPLIQVQERIDETEYQRLVLQYTQAFRQRLLVAGLTASEIEEIKTSAGRWNFLDMDPEEVKVIDLPEAQLDGLLRSAEAGKRDFAARGNIPAQSLGIDGISNVSSDTLASLELQRNREASEISTALGESHEQLLRTCALLMGNMDAARDWEAEIQWRPFEARTLAGVVDALGKMVQQIGLPSEIAIEDIPGMTAQKLQRIKEEMGNQAANATADRYRYDVNIGDGTKDGSSEVTDPDTGVGGKQERPPKDGFSA